jgi:uroporphyrinogen decarboxylase
MGIDMLNPVEPGCMDIVELKRRYEGRLVLSGNVDVDLLTRGEPADVERCVRRLLREVAPGGGYLLASGNSVASYTRVDNVLRMCETNYRAGRYPIEVE